MPKARKRQRTEQAAALGDATRVDDKDDEELALEDAVFGSAPAGRTRKAARESEDGDDALGELNDNDLFFVDDAGGEDAAAPTPAQGRKARKNAAWVDADDEQLRVNIAENKRLRKLRDVEGEDEVRGADYESRLRRQYEKLNPTPAWLSKARSKRRKHAEDEDDDDDEPLGDILTSTSSLLAHHRPSTLPSGDLNITRLRDANISTQQSSHSLHSAAFHPSPSVPVLLTTASDRRVRLYTVDGHANAHLQTLHVPEIPQPTAVFSPSGGAAYLTGMAPHFWTYDLQSGQVYKSHKLDDSVKSSLVSALSPSGATLAFAGGSGVVSLVDARAKQAVASLKANGALADLRFTGAGGNEHELTALGHDAEVYVFDVRARRCVGRWRDVDGFGGSVLGAGGGGRYLATGSSTGYVNVYGAAAGAGMAERPPLLKALPHLTTRVSKLVFSPDAQILAMTSSAKKDQLKLVHLPSMTVFRNWPTSGTPLHTVHCVAFSPGSEFLVVGNAAGRALLYHLPYFASAR